MADLLPSGATPIDPDEADDLIPDHIVTRAELNEWEQVNIIEGVRWIRGRKDVEFLLTVHCIKELHKKMFSKTWKWAGRLRWTMKNIGVHPEAIIEETEKLLADTKFWIENRTYVPDELGARFHHRLVFIHLFANGNGRHARLLTDALMNAMGVRRFTWGAGSIDDAGAVRDAYISALRAADGGDYAALLNFVRS